jgi:hypothetical protein
MVGQFLDNVIAKYGLPLFTLKQSSHHKIVYYFLGTTWYLDPPKEEP